MTSRARGTGRWSLWMVLCAFAFVFSTLVMADNTPSDPGPRGGNAGAGGQIANLTGKEAKFFDTGANEFQEFQSVTGSVAGTEPGLGPRFNSNSCASCHAHPAIGGTSPAINPQVSLATQAQVDKVTVTVPIISANGPVREVRFRTDGGVHDLFTIVGLPGAGNCTTLSQPDFEGAAAADGGFPGILRFRIPTPTFGLGLIEAIEDFTILSNVHDGKPFGILGSVNRNGNDGTVTRFGWKAQNKSLVIFSGEAYNVEQGITNELFPDERGEGGTPDSPECRRILPAPQDSVKYELTQPQKVIDNVNDFSNFMRFLAAPVQVTSYTSVTQGPITHDQILLGQAAFTKAGCDICHMPSMTTGSHVTAALTNKTVNLFSDLLVHDVNTADGISQGGANGFQFRTAPLWGVGQRLFFLHDGRTSDIVTAIKAHGGEATRVINNFNGVSVAPDDGSNLSGTESQNLVYFLRSL
jgi:CxxC motif-containing protein (DUF1111 family)